MPGGSVVTTLTQKRVVFPSSEVTLGQTRKIGIRLIIYIYCLVHSRHFLPNRKLTTVCRSMRLKQITGHSGDFTATFIDRGTYFNRLWVCVGFIRYVGTFSRVPVLDPASGDILHVINHKRILRFLYIFMNELPAPSFMNKVGIVASRLLLRQMQSPRCCALTYWGGGFEH